MTFSFSYSVSVVSHGKVPPARVAYLGRQNFNGAATILVAGYFGQRVPKRNVPYTLSALQPIDRAAFGRWLPLPWITPAARGEEDLKSTSLA
jgi:hypothetical protein